MAVLKWILAAVVVLFVLAGPASAQDDCPALERGIKSPVATTNYLECQDERVPFFNE